ncbi:MAG: kelch motif-containing protein [Thermoplasmata archaeon]|nr:kelch motif-containing protein [Thermoplasmata archaeon]
MPDVILGGLRPRGTHWLAVLLVAGLVGTGAFSSPSGSHLLASGASHFPVAPVRIAHPLLKTGELQHALFDLSAGINRHTRSPLTVCAALRMPVPGLCGTPPDPARPAPLGGGAGWGLTGPNPPPQQPNAFEITYDAWDSYVLLFGMVPDYNSSGGVSDTWAYVLGNWTPIATTGGPVACAGSSLAYDSEDGYVVFFGGLYVGYSSTPCPSAGQTWSYRSGSWTELTPTTSPPASTGASFADDTGDGYMVLFGGDTASYPRGSNDTWKFVGGSWTELTPVTAPSARSQAGLAYDAYDGYLLLFGGMATSYYIALNDTWNFTKGNWTQMAPAHSPPVPQPDAFSYDANDQEILYTTAYSWNATTLETLWAFKSGDWSAVSYTSGPIQRLDAATAYDAGSAYLVLFGGIGVSPLADTWSFSGGGWTNHTPPTPPPRANAATAYDAADGYEVMFGGSTCATPSSSTCPDHGDTWAYTVQGAWINLTPNPSPPARERAGMVYDAADGYILLFGGDAAGQALNDTWKFLAGTWTQLAPSKAPSIRTAGTMVFDAADGYVLLFGGDAALTFPYAGDYRDTWSFVGGVWTNRTGSITASPPAEATNRMVYDAADGYVLLFGTFARTTYSLSAWSLSQNQTWTYAGGTWTNRTASVGPAPAARTDAAMTYDTRNQSVLLFGGTSTPGVWWGDTWSFARGSWSVLPTTLSPYNRSGASLEYDPTVGAALLFGGTSGWYPNNYQDPSCEVFFNDLCPDLWAWGGSSSSVGPLTIAGFHATAPILDLGLTAQFSTTVHGGAPPYSFAYAGLPSGCASANLSILDCVPSVTGTFDVNVSVHDSGTNSSFGALVLEVVPDPAVLAFAAAPATVTVGNATTFLAQLSGGVAPFAIGYTGLPSSCASAANASAANLSFPCSPQAVGTYSVQINVLDAEGLRAQGTTQLVVRAAGSPGPNIAGFAAAPSTIVLGNTTAFTVTPGVNAGALSFLYTGLPPGCASNDTASLACTPTAAGAFQVEVTATATNGSSTLVATNLAVQPLGGGLDPLVTAFGASPNPDYTGQTTVLSVVASGGSGTLAYRYAGLPSGCPAADLPQLACAPSASGRFLVEAIVDDAAGHSTGVLTHLTVLLSANVVLPSVTAFYPSPSKIVVGASTLFLVTASGGTAPLRYAFSTLPPGCVSANTPSLPCSPGETGQFRVGVNISDASGSTVNATTLLTVGPANASSPSSSGSALDPYLLVGSVLLAVAGAVALVVAVIVRRAQRPSSPDSKPPQG